MEPALVLFPSASSRMLRRHVEYDMVLVCAAVKKFIE
jgi:hypothetical protein